MVKIGDVVTYIDENRKERNALVQFVHSPHYINVIVISEDESKSDSYGRQTEHATSVPFKTDMNAAGRHFIEKA